MNEAVRQTETPQTLRLRTPSEKAARRRREKQLALEVAAAAQRLADARGYAEIYIARALYIQATGKLRDHHMGQKV